MEICKDPAEICIDPVWICTDPRGIRVYHGESRIDPVGGRAPAKACANPALIRMELAKNPYRFCGHPHPLSTRAGPDHFLQDTKHHFEGGAPQQIRPLVDTQIGHSRPRAPEESAVPKKKSEQRGPGGSEMSNERRARKHGLPNLKEREQNDLANVCCDKKRGVFSFRVPA